MKRVLPCILVLAFFFAGNATGQNEQDPEHNFEVLWQTFDRNYGIFLPKGINWQNLYDVYRPKVTSETTEDELFDIMSQMLGHLNDNHVRLRSQTRSFCAGILEQVKNEGFSLDLIKDKFLTNGFEDRLNGRFHFGWAADSIGYFHFSGFQDISASSTVVDEIIQTFKDAKGLIIDIRNNFGGDDRVGKAIAGRFADKKRLYMTTQIRNGPEHDDLTPPKHFYAESEGPSQFTKPIILLTHRYSISGADNFALAMRTMPHVTSVGEATSGCLADMRWDRLPNGWGFSISYTLFVDQDGFCWEGIGVPVNIRQVNRSEDIERGHDKPLELAIALLQSGMERKPCKRNFPLQGTE